MKRNVVAAVLSLLALSSNAMAGYLRCISQDAPERGLQVSHQYTGGTDEGLYLLFGDEVVPLVSRELFPGGSSWSSLRAVRALDGTTEYALQLESAGRQKKASLSVTVDGELRQQVRFDCVAEDFAE